MADAPTRLGVINLSPESMVKDSIVQGEDQLLARAAWLADQGVAWMDLGGRSITPDAPMVDDATEQARLEPAVRRLREVGFEVSVDTWSPDTARRALDWGARFVNYTREELPEELLAESAERGATLCLCFMPYGDAYRMREARRVPVGLPQIVDFLGPRVERARAAGVAEVVVDPNLGILHADTDDFRKSHLQLHVLWNLDALRALGCPVLLYAARKPERLARILMASAVLHARPDYVRTHEPDILDALQLASEETPT